MSLTWHKTKMERSFAALDNAKQMSQTKRTSCFDRSIHFPNVKLEAFCNL